MIKRALTISSTGSSRPSCRFEKGVAFLAGVTGMGWCSGGEARDVWEVNPRRTCASNGTGAHPICPTGNSLKHFTNANFKIALISSKSQLFVFIELRNRHLKLKVVDNDTRSLHHYLKPDIICLRYTTLLFPCSNINHFLHIFLFNAGTQITKQECFCFQKWYKSISFK